jgi:hypothetical protein
MYTGKTTEDERYNYYFSLTKTALIRNIFSNIESSKIRNKVFSEIHTDKIKEFYRLQNEIDELKEFIDMQKEEINELTKQKISVKQPILERKTYIIKDCNNGLYKIGFSNNPIKREKTLQSQNPNIKIVKVFEKNIEKELHLNYKEFRVRGEWFNLNNTQIDYICKKY